MTPAESFLQDIVANPDEDAPRLVYADWLDDHGDEADRAHAEFIRLGCELARLPEGDRRREELDARAAAIEKARAKEWLAPLRKALDRRGSRQLHRWSFSRGFLERLVLRPRRPDFLGAAGGILSQHPLRTLELYGDPSLPLDRALADLARVPSLKSVRRLEFYGYPPASAGEGLRLLGSAPGLGGVTQLDLSVDLTTAGFAGLVGTPLAARLEYLGPRRALRKRFGRAFHFGH